MNKSTLVLGASLKDYRYSNICINTLLEAGIPVTAIGLREGNIREIPVITGFPDLENINTISLYLSPVNQHSWYDYILKLNPSRVIFNPGSENPPFSQTLVDAGIEVVEGCTIVMVKTGSF